MSCNIQSGWFISLKQNHRYAKNIHYIGSWSISNSTVVLELVHYCPTFRTHDGLLMVMQTLGGNRERKPKLVINLDVAKTWRWSRVKTMNFIFNLRKTHLDKFLAKRLCHLYLSLIEIGPWVMLPVVHPTVSMPGIGIFQQYLKASNVKKLKIVPLTLWST